MKSHRNHVTGIGLLAVLLVACGGPPQTEAPPQVEPTVLLDAQDAPTPEPQATIDEASLSDATALPPSVDPAVPLIAFVSASGGEDFEIFVVEPGGLNLLQLTDNGAQDFAPAWSPDRTQIAFHSDRDGNEELYLMQADGSGQMRLTDDPAADTFPAWSPDGSRLAFVSTRGGGADVWLVNLQSGELAQLTNDADDEANLDWSPDGTRLAYTVFRTGQPTLRVTSVDAPGTGTDLVAGGLYPDWSPDGLTLAYFTSPEGVPRVFLAQSDGANPLPLISDPTPVHSPSFSPDGAQLVVVALGDPASDLWVLDADGGGALRLTDGMNPLMPRWSS